MTTKFYLTKYFLSSFYISGVLLLLTFNLKAQMCSNPTDTIYGLGSTGLTAGILTPINVNNALLGPVRTASGSAVNSNGLGYSTNGKFYFFNQTGTGAAPSPQFASYSPATGLIILANPPGTIAVGQKIRTGCVNNIGTGYYTLDPSGANPTLYYYNITLNTWTTITSNFDSLAGAPNSLNTTFKINSGDMAFDGQGNLWVLVSNGPIYGLYEIPSPVPTTAVARISAIKQIIPATSSTPGGVSITGLAFNSAGTLFMATGAGLAAGNNKLYKMTSVAAGLTLIGTFVTDDTAGDLTSCSFPMFVLPASPMQNFTAVLNNNNGVKLTWTAIDDEATTGYNVEHSTDAAHWTSIAFIEKQSASTTYNYTHYQYADNNYYRIIQTSVSGKEDISAIKFLSAKGTKSIHLGPNPAKDVIYFYNKDKTAKYLAQFFDRSGRLIYSTSIDKTQESVNISRLQKGAYILKLSSPAEKNSSSYQFIKW